MDSAIRLRLEELEDRMLPSFVLAGTVNTGGSNAVFVTSGYFNRDGIADLAVVNRGSGTVSVLFGNGDGTFQSPMILPVGSNPTSFAVGDLLGNHRTDLVVANGAAVSSDVSVLLANSNGTFQPAQNFSVGGQPFSVAVADLNGDGKPDIVVANGQGNVGVLLNTSSGYSLSFAPVKNLAVGSGPYSVTATDFNGDGLMDLAVVDHSGKSVSVLLGNGDGTFKPAQNFPAGNYPSSMASADLNGDGKPDLAVANYGSNTVSILLNTSTGGNLSFVAAQNLSAGVGPSAIAIADFNDVGLPGLVVTNLRSHTVSVFFGLGNGTFLPQEQVFLGSGVYSASIAVVDLNNDGQPDLVTANGGTNNIDVLMNASAPPFQGLKSFIADGTAVGVAAGDINGDGFADVVAADSNTHYVSVFLSNGDGTLQNAQNISVGRYPYAVAIIDVNGDGKADLIVANRADNTVSVLLGNGNGTFQPGQVLPVGGAPTFVLVADVNGDGIPDLITSNQGGKDVSVLLGNGNGTFQAAQNFSTGNYAYQLQIADVNGDHRPDLVVAVRNGVVVLPGNGNGTFGPPQTVLGYNPGILALADLNGDGKTDLVIPSASRYSVGVLLGNGNGTFRPSIQLPSPTSVVFLLAGDVNGDGIPDLVVGNQGSLMIFPGNGDGTFQAPERIADSTYQYWAALGDVNGDGRPDLVLSSRRNSSVSVLLRTAATQLQIGNPTVGVAGNSLFITVTALDPLARVDPRYTGTVTFSSTDPRFVAPAPYTFTLADQGRHTFMLSLKTSGLQTISVTDGQNSATTTGISVKPALASQLFFKQQPLGGIISAPVNPAPTLELLDAFNNLVSSSASVTVTAVGPGSFSSSSTTTVVASNGIASFSNLLLSTPGSYTINAASAGLAGASSVSFIISPASTRTWSGLGPDNLWSDPANWRENQAPDPGDDLFFPDGAARMMTGTNDFVPGTSFNSINFSGAAGGYELEGNGVTLTNGIMGNAGPSRIDLSGITLAGAQTFQAGNASMGISSSINLNGFTLTLDGSQSIPGGDVLSGTISAGGAIIKNGVGTWQLSGANTFTGATSINAGTLAVNNSSSLGSATNNATVNATGSLQVSNNITVSQALTINGDGNNTSAGAIDIRDIHGNDSFGPIALGSASTILSANLGVNTMTLSSAVQNNGFDLSVVGGGGYTTILSGSGTISGTGHVLNFGSIFSGTGTLNSVLNINQGTLSPGSGGNPGTLNSSDVNFGIGTNFTPILGNSSTSLLNSTGSVNLSGSNLSLSFQSGFMPNPGTSYVIIQATGSVNGTFNGLPDGSPIIVGGQRFVIRCLNSTASSLHPSAPNGRIVIFPVPAPTTTSLFATPNPVIAGQSETFTAIVTSPAAATAGVSSSVITGTVSFFDGANLIGSGPVAGGAASFTTTSLVAGNHSITASFSDPSNTFSASSSAAVTLAVNSNSVGWQDVMTRNFTAGKNSDIAGMTAGGQWWVAVSNGSSFTNQFWGSWPVATWVDVQTGDFNGDGLADIAGRNSQTGQWYVAQSTGSSFTTTVWTTWNPNVMWTDVKVGDFNGDGKSDIVGRLPQTGQWFVAQSTGSSFVSSLWATWNPNVTWVDVNVGNFAGNKTTDITGRWQQGGSWWTAVSNGTSFNTSLWAQWNPNVTWVDVKVGDFNGDGKADLTARWMEGGSWWTSISSGSSFTTSFWAQWSPNVIWVDVKVGDFNGDGKADIVGRYLEGGEWFTGLSTGSAFLTSLWNTWSPAVTWVDVSVGDVNGDGVPDLVGRIQQNGQWWAALSNGSTAFTNQLWTTWAV
jgi:autotransporter-associated beta strand protein